MQLFTCGWLPAAASPKALVFLCHGSNQATPLQAAALHALMSLAVSCFSYYYYLLSFSALQIQYRYEPSLTALSVTTRSHCVGVVSRRRLRHGVQWLHERYVRTICSIYFGVAFSFASFLFNLHFFG